MSEVVQRYRDAFEAQRAALPGAGIDWLDAAREKALAHFESRGFPKPREEDWKYTRTASIEKVAFSTPEAGAAVDIDAHVLALGGPTLVFVDGILDPAASTLAQREGISVQDLTWALSNDAERVSAHMSRHVDTTRHAFTALNTALTGSGAFIHVARNQVVAEPIQLLFLATGRADCMVHPRIIIAAESGASLTVVEHYVGLAESRYINNVLTEASVGSNAALTHYKVQREAATAFHISTLAVHQEADSRFTSHSISLGAALARHDIHVDLAGRGASCALNGLYIADARRHVDYHTLIEHSVPHCSSDEDYKGILGGRGRGVFNGRVIVHKDAQKTDASQSNANLLLSADAEIDTKPQLEIFADDVKCAHGATVGQLDERMIFYLRSRGLSDAEARALLTYGFARDVVDRMDIAALAEIVADTLLDQMPHASTLRSMLS